MNSISSTQTLPSQTSDQNSTNNLELYPFAEWFIYPDPIESVIFKAAQELHIPFLFDIVKLLTEYLQNLNAFNNIFGSDDWNAIFGKVRRIKATYEMEAILQSQSPFNQTQKIIDTCVCILIPSEVNNEPLTPALMEKFAANPLHHENRSEYILGYQAKIKEEFEYTNQNQSYWVLITKESIPNSRKKTYSEQIALIPKDISWQIPSVRETCICASAHFAKTGQQLFLDTEKPLTFVTCLGDLKEIKMMGGFNGTSLSVFTFHSSCSFLNTVACVRRFLPQQSFA